MTDATCALSASTLTVVSAFTKLDRLVTGIAKSVLRLAGSGATAAKIARATMDVVIAKRMSNISVLHNRDTGAEEQTIRYFSLQITSLIRTLVQLT